MKFGRNSDILHIAYFTSSELMADEVYGHSCSCTCLQDAHISRTCIWVQLDSILSNKYVRKSKAVRSGDPGGQATEPCSQIKQF